MTSFIKRKIETLTLGEKLKKIREKSGISLVEVATQTKIKKEYLEKIEKSDYEKLPFDVYVRGFLRNYARYLNLDSEKVVNQFNREIGVRDNIKKYQTRKNSDENRFNFPSLVITPKMVSVFFSILVVLIGFSYFYFEVDSFSKDPSLIIENPLSDQIVKDSSIEVVGKTDFENKITINNEAIFVDSDGFFREKIGLQQGVNEITIEAFNKFGKINSKKINLIANYEIETVVAGEADISKDKETDDFQVEIETRENSIRLFYQLKNQEEKETIIYPGTSFRIKVEDEIKISSSKASDTYVKINGEDFFAINSEKKTGNDFKTINLNKKGVF